MELFNLTALLVLASKISLVNFAFWMFHDLSGMFIMVLKLGYCDTSQYDSKCFRTASAVRCDVLKNPQSMSSILSVNLWSFNFCLLTLEVSVPVSFTLYDSLKLSATSSSHCEYANKIRMILTINAIVRIEVLF
jgi:hypothetical protein